MVNDSRQFTHLGISASKESNRIHGKQCQDQDMSPRQDIFVFFLNTGLLCLQSSRHREPLTIPDVGLKVTGIAPTLNPHQITVESLTNPTNLTMANGQQPPIATQPPTPLKMPSLAEAAPDLSIQPPYRLRSLPRPATSAQMMRRAASLLLDGKLGPERLQQTKTNHTTINWDAGEGG